MTFADDLAVGQEVERKVLKTIQASYPKALMIDGYFKDFDILVPETKQAIEVKYDIKSEKTGNVCVEISFGGKDSGLITTKADWWVFVVHDGIYWVKTERLKFLIIKHTPQLIPYTPKGETKQATAYIVKKTILAQYAIFKPTSPYIPHEC